MGGKMEDQEDSDSEIEAIDEEQKDAEKRRISGWWEETGLVLRND